jgi:hypothetical protein
MKSKLLALFWYLDNILLTLTVLLSSSVTNAVCDNKQ